MKPKIMIDAGHGGHDSGAVGPNGLQEKDVALTVAMLLGAMLLPDFEVNYTRRDDTFVELSKRAMIANDWQADLFLSIHCNSGPAGQGTGFEVFTSVGETTSDRFATDLFQSFGAEFPTKARRVEMADGDPDKEAGFAVIRLTHMRAALFELEFIHTVAGETFLGGSGRNLVIAGLPAADPGPDGLYRAGKPDFWDRSDFTVEVTGPSAATISDGVDVVAILTTGGTAPLGGFDSTTYGADIT